MTRALAALALALCCAGCAARTIPASVQRIADASWGISVRPAAATAATVLRWRAPAVLRDGSPAHDRQDQIVLRLRGRSARWAQVDSLALSAYPDSSGAFRSAMVAAIIVPHAFEWQQVVAQCTPETVGVVRGVLPGAACSLAVAPGQHVVVARNAAGPSGWSNVVVTTQ